MFIFNKSVGYKTCLFQYTYTRILNNSTRNLMVKNSDNSLFAEVLPINFAKSTKIFDKN